jgi:hypothetical protein
MITKKLGTEEFAWEPNAFGGKGYWFVLGKKGGLGRAASKKEASTLGKPKDSEVNPANPKVLDSKPAKKPKKQVQAGGEEGEDGEETPKGKMGYSEAAKIRKRGILSSIMEKKFEEGKGFGTSIRETVSEKTKATFKGFKEKLDPLNWVKGLTGSGAIGKSIRTVAGRAMGRSEEDIDYFGGYTKDKKQKKKGGTAELISSGPPKAPGATVSEDDDAAAIVMKIYDLLKKSYEDEKKANELANAKKGTGKIGGTFVPTKTASGAPSAAKEKEGGGSLIDNVLGMFNLGRTALSLLTSLGPLLVNPITLTLLGVVAAGTVGAWMIKQISADPQAALAGKGGIGMAVAGLGSEGQMETPTADEESRKKMASSFDKKGLKGASTQELEAKKAEILDVGVDPRIKQKKGWKLDDNDNKRLQLIEQIDAEISSRKQTASPAAGAPASPSAPASGGEGSSGGAGGGGGSSSSPSASPSGGGGGGGSSPSATPVPASPTSGAQMEAATKQNNEVQMDAQSGSTTPIVMNSTNNSATPGSSKSAAVGAQPVRDSESSVLRAKIGSVRMV